MRQLFPPFSRYLFSIHFVLGSIEGTEETQHSHAFEVFTSSLLMMSWCPDTGYSWFIPSLSMSQTSVTTMSDLSASVHNSAEGQGEKH